MNKNCLRNFRLSLLAAVIVFIIIVSVFFSTSNQRITSENPRTYNQNWSVYTNDIYIDQVSLPNKIEADKNDKIRLQKLLNDDFIHNQVLMIRGSLQSVQVLVDDQTIYLKDFENNAFNTYASLFHFVQIPENSDGKTIEIILISPYENMSGTLNDIHFGSQSQHLDLLLEHYEFKLFIAIFLVFISVLFIIISQIIFNKQQKYNIYIGLVGVFLGLWIFAESRISQLYFNNDFLIGSLAYLSLAAAPIAALPFIKHYLFDNKRKIYSYLSILFMVNLFVIVFLHTLQIYAFFETVTITITLISIAFIITIILLVQEYLQTRNKKYLNYTIILLIFSIFIFLEVVGFANKNFSDTANFASTGIFLVLLIIFAVTIFTLTKKLKYNHKQQLYEEIATTDQLTKAGSRFAFELEFDNLFYNSNLDISLIYFDFDDLKHINDYYGHLEGDITLINGYHTINKVFSEYGKCYRVGGDEFACLSRTLDKKTFFTLKENLKNELKAIYSQKPYSMNISIGYTKLDLKTDKKPSDLIIRADKEMYLDKSKNKAQAE